MRVYSEVIFEWRGAECIEISSVSKTYHGVCGCQMKGGQKAAQEEQRLQAERSYQLQLEIFEDQKQQMALLEQGKSSESAAKTRDKERKLSSKRVGRKATILTGPVGVRGPASVSNRTLLGG